MAFSAQTFLVDEIIDDLLGREQGYVKTIKVGKNIFPYCIPPQVEVVLLDPVEQTVVFRPATDPESLAPKKGNWTVGKPVDVVSCIMGWSETMLEVQKKEHHG